MEVKIKQTNVLTVRASDVGLQPTQNPYVLRQDSGVIGGVNDVFGLVPPQPGDIIVFDPVTQKYKNVTMSGTSTVNSVGVMSLTSIRNRTKTITTSVAPQVNFTTEDKFIITALATDTTFSAPIGTFEEGSLLLYRVRDNGVARLLSWNAIYRAGNLVILPTVTTPSKWMSLGFIYNVEDVKWDLIAFVNGN